MLSGASPAPRTLNRMRLGRTKQQYGNSKQAAVTNHLRRLWRRCGRLWLRYRRRGKRGLLANLRQEGSATHLLLRQENLQ